jgi:two-component system cell cycle response regulator
MAKKARILCVDDEPIIRLTLESLLMDEHIDLVFAENGPAGLEKARECLPDAILLDVMMPGMDGYEVCRQLRSDPDLAEVPIVMVTALDNRESRLAGLDAGADDFLTKPFDSMEIQIRIKNILHLNRYRSLVTERARFLWMVEHSDDGYLILSELNAIQYANPRAQLLLQLPDNYVDIDFSSQVERHYQAEPAEFWEKWGEEPPNGFLVQPESSTARSCWLQVSGVDTPLGQDNHRIVRLRDVTDKILVDQDMRKFHTVVAHKLRTPANQIYGSMALLVEHMKEFDGEEVNSLVETAWRGSERLVQEVCSILEYIDAPVCLNTSTMLPLNTVSAMVMKIAQDHEIPNVSVCLPDELTPRTIGMPADAMELILHEVLENAVKFHPQHNPKVEVDFLETEPGKVCIRISDDGLTLTAEQLHRAWIPYFQGEKYFSGEAPGMGLGLPTVASLVWQAGGRVRLANQETGPGTQVELTLPLTGEQM